MKKRYDYYVSYYWFSNKGNGVGSKVVDSAGKIMTMDHIEQVRKYIMESENKIDVVVLSWNEIDRT